MAPIRHNLFRIGQVVSVPRHPLLWLSCYLFFSWCQPHIARIVAGVSEQLLFATANSIFIVFFMASIALEKTYFERTWRDIATANILNAYTWLQIWWLLGMNLQNKFR